MNIITWNSTAHFASTDHARLVELAGLIPHWAATYHHTCGTLREYFERCYTFGLSYHDGGAVVLDQLGNGDGVYNYPEDPPLYPIMKIETGDAICYVYEYGLISFIEKQDDGSFKQFHTRMD